MWRNKDLTGNEQVWYSKDDILNIVEDACDVLGMSFHAKVELTTEIERSLE